MWWGAWNRGGGGVATGEKGQKKSALDRKKLGQNVVQWQTESENHSIHRGGNGDQKTETISPVGTFGGEKLSSLKEGKKSRAQTQKSQRFYQALSRKERGERKNGNHEV